MLEYDMDQLMKEMAAGEQHSREFIECATQFLTGYMRYKKWVEKYSDRFRNAGGTEKASYDLCIKFIDMFRSIRYDGLKHPVVVEKGSSYTLYDGWHRTLIMRVLGKKRIPYVERNKK